MGLFKKDHWWDNEYLRQAVGAGGALLGMVGYIVATGSKQEDQSTDLIDIEAEKQRILEEETKPRKRHWSNNNQRKRYKPHKKKQFSQPQQQHRRKNNQNQLINPGKGHWIQDQTNGNWYWVKD